MWPLAGYSGTVLSVTVLVALLVCLIPTTIGGLLSAIGIAGMDRLIRFNVIATSGRAVEAAGDVDTLLLDKTGTITFGNRMADGVHRRCPASPSASSPRRRCLRASPTRRRKAARSSPCAKSKYGLARAAKARAETRMVVPFSAQTRMSGVDLAGAQPPQRRGRRHPRASPACHASAAPAAFRQAVDRIARTGGTPLAVAENGRLLGVIHLKDIVKPDIKRALRGAARHGHQDRDGDRRQSA